MSYILDLAQLDRDSLASAGGKGANLGELIRAGLPVPPGFVVTAQAYRTVLETSGLREKIAHRLSKLQPQDLDALTAASRDVAGWILEAPVPAPIQAAVLQAYRNLGDHLAVAVRSSATAEDLPSASFAGQQETYLHIEGEAAVLAHVRKCWASLWTPQAVSYRASMGFDHLKVELAVVVQAMVPADVAGVMFTANPVTGARNEILISASYGLGESVVSGAVTPDTFVITADGAIRQRTLGTKESRIVPAQRGTRTEPVPGAQRGRYCLTDKDLAGLASLAQKVEAHYGAPQDTEWALAGGKLYLLQARPITTMAAEADLGPDPGWDPEILYKGKKLPFTVSLEYFPEPPTPLDSYQFDGKSFDNFFATLGVMPSKKPTGAVERRDGRVALAIGHARISPSVLWRLPVSFLRAMRKEPADCWHAVEQEFTAWLARNRAAEKKTNKAPELARILHQMTLDLDRLFEKRLHAVFLQGVVNAMMVSLWVRMAVGKKAAADMTARIYRALPFRTVLQNQALGRLAKVAAIHGKESAEFGAALERFLAEYGHRPALGTMPMPSLPTLRERPEVVKGLVAALLDAPTAMEPDEAFRKQEGVLSAPGDAFFLFTSELIPAATGAIAAADVRARVARRKDAFARVSVMTSEVSTG